jgi:hypothetical protein
MQTVFIIQCQGWGDMALYDEDTYVNVSAHSTLELANAEIARMYAEDCVDAQDHPMRVEQLAFNSPAL